MNFEQLNQSLETAVEQNHKKRGKASLGSYQKGMRALMRASQEGFENKELLHIARRAFLETIQNQRSQPDGYLGMGYLLLLLNVPEKAQEFILHAYQLATDKTYAQELLNYCQRQLDIKNRSSTEDDHVLIQEMQQALNYFRQNHPLQNQVPWREPEALGAVVAQGLNLLAQFERRIADIERELDIPDAHQLRRNLDAHLKSLNAHYRLAQHGQQLYQQMRETQKDIVSLNKAIRQQEAVPLREELLEKLLDRCDDFADRLEHWMSEKWEFGELLQHYERLVHEIETLQDMFDTEKT